MGVCFVSVGCSFCVHWAFVYSFGGERDEQTNQSDIACGVTVLTILLLVVCFFYVLWKIYSDEDINEPESSVKFLPKQGQRQKMRTKIFVDKISNGSECTVPHNTPIGSVDV